VFLSKHGKKKNLKVHRIVLEAFCGKCPDAMETAHIDGDVSNPSRDNLMWVTRKENAFHRDHIHNTQSRGETSVLSKLTNSDVGRVRESKIFGAAAKDLAAIYGVSPNTIYKIVDRSRWAHLQSFNC
jgi:hypothetical protein